MPTERRYGRTLRLEVTKVRALNRYRLAIEFRDGVKGVVDLEDLAGDGVFACWEAPGAFEDVAVGSGGEVTWACGVDLCADALYLRLTGKSVEDIFPALRSEHSVA